MPTYIAASCEEADVQAKINLATHGDIVEIPIGDCTWTSQVSVSVGLHLRGAGQGVTIIRDNITKDGTAASVPFSVSVNSPNSFKLSDLTVVGVAADPGYFRGYVALGGTQTGFRVHHITLSNGQTTFVVTSDCAYGLIDHVTIGGGRILVSAQHATCGSSNYGDYNWGTASTLGTASAVYVEDSDYTGVTTLIGDDMTDAFNGGKFVFRYNTAYLGTIGAHGTDSSQRQRSQRHMEVYGNTFTFHATTAVDRIPWVRGGTGLIFNNSASGLGGLNSFVKAQNLRDTGSYTPWGQCDGSSQYDENASGGYRCVDQPGSGQSDDLGGTATPPDGWVGNIKEPIYQWANTSTFTPSVGWISGSANVVNNRDYFQQASGIQTSSSSPFNGTSGTGWGTLANRPSTCTAGASSTPGVGYFATDEQKLYRCTATDQWTLYYTPYTYPHPLQNGDQETPAPSTQVPVRKTRLHWLGGFGWRRKH